LGGKRKKRGQWAPMKKSFYTQSCILNVGWGKKGGKPPGLHKKTQRGGDAYFARKEEKNRGDENHGESGLVDKGGKDHGVGASPRGRISREKAEEFPIVQRMGNIKKQGKKEKWS